MNDEDYHHLKFTWAHVKEAKELIKSLTTTRETTSRLTKPRGSIIDISSRRRSAEGSPSPVANVNTTPKLFCVLPDPQSATAWNDPSDLFHHKVRLHVLCEYDDNWHFCAHRGIGLPPHLNTRQFLKRISPMLKTIVSVMRAEAAVGRTFRMPIPRTIKQTEEDVLDGIAEALQAEFPDATPVDEMEEGVTKVTADIYSVLRDVMNKASGVGGPRRPNAVGDEEQELFFGVGRRELGTQVRWMCPAHGAMFDVSGTPQGSEYDHVEYLRDERRIRGVHEQEMEDLKRRMRRTLELIGVKYIDQREEEKKQAEEEAERKRREELTRRPDVRIHKTGYLIKQGGSKGGLFSKKNWKRRFFFLAHGHLVYYESKNKEKLLGDIELRRGHISLTIQDQFDKHHEHKYYFQLHIRAANNVVRTILLEAPTEEERESWARAIESWV